MYSNTMGAAYNYGGQNNVPGKSTNTTDQTTNPQNDYMSYQMQQFGQPRRSRQQPQQPPPSMNNTPVMPNGQPSPPQPQQPQYFGSQLQGLKPPSGTAPSQPAAQPPAPAPAQPAGSPGPGWVNINGGWYPPDHPAALQYNQQQQTQQQQAGLAAGAAANPQQGNPGFVDAQGVYHAGAAPNITYNAQQVAKFQQPGQLNPVNNQILGNIQGLLGSGGSLNPEVVAQMKGANKDQAALQGQQQLGQQQQQLASSGRNLDSGQAQALQRAIQNQTDQNVLGGNRAIDINAATQNRQDMLNALGAGNQATSNVLGQAIQGYGANLQGQQQNQGEQLAQLSSIYQPFNTNTALLGQQAQTQQGAIGQGMQGRSLDLQGQSLANQMSQFNQTNQLAYNQFDWQKQQAALQQQMQQQENAAANNRYYDSLAMDYTNGQNSDQNSLFSWLMQNGGQ